MLLVNGHPNEYTLTREWPRRHGWRDGLQEVSRRVGGCIQGVGLTLGPMPGAVSQSAPARPSSVVPVAGMTESVSAIGASLGFVRRDLDLNLRVTRSATVLSNL